MAAPVYESADIPPTSGEDSPDSGHCCEDCGTPVPPTASGRQFTKCLDCRRAARALRNGDTPSPRSSRGRWQEPLSTQLTLMGEGIGSLVGLFDEFDGAVIRKGAEPLAMSLIKPAEMNTKVRKTLETIANGGAWGAVGVAALGIIMPIAMHHGWVKPGMFARQPQRREEPTPDKSHEGHVSV